MCTCDMHPEPHPDGYVAPDGTTCEKALLGPRISPHLEASLKEMGLSQSETAPPLSDSQLATLQRILHQDASARGAHPSPGV